MSSEHNPQPAEEPYYPIRTVANLTGINPVTLRAWERRYALLQPHRTPKGHRLYTRQDIERVRETVMLLKTGIPISQVRTHLDQRAAPIDELPAPAPAQEGSGPWTQYFDRMLAAIERFDDTLLDAVYNEALSLYPVDLVTVRLIQPLLRRLGEQWQTRPGGVAEEHYFSTYLRNRLGARLHHLAPRRARPRVLAACLPGEQHETGLLLFCLIAASRGYGLLMLGANTPFDQVAYAARTGGCDAIVFSATTPPPAEAVGAQLAELVSTVGMPVLLGGHACAGLERTPVASSGVILLGEDLYAAAERLRTLLGPAHD
ncbi:MerR family transcriptional regulator [Acidihalobacter ferrooxydans]|uniref:HTH merR-type domain-containing protein n=1 Tax=Acidihalobacter ferrooxydans TaxID=1765967 RepID=A0A1P8UGB0_9GAMM|nr:MerR family transcriptional regulator [Acidihalobacter ferrooxydans]APZ42855.1 hypothetical protein BW247_06895 [Acidihalobacter ferrooxydans]